MSGKMYFPELNMELGKYKEHRSYAFFTIDIYNIKMVQKIYLCICTFMYVFVSFMHEILKKT